LDEFKAVLKVQLNISDAKVGILTGTLHSKLTVGFFSWPKSIYCDLSLTNCTFVKLELRVQGTHFYGDGGEFDGRHGINLGIWSQWLYHGTDDKLVLVVTVASIVTGIMGLLQ